MSEYSFDETLEGIIKMFHEDTSLFVLIETLIEDDIEISEYLEANR